MKYKTAYIANYRWHISGGHILSADNRLYRGIILGAFTCYSSSNHLIENIKYWLVEYG